MFKKLLLFCVAIFLFRVQVLAQAFSCGTSSVTFTYAGSTITYQTVIGVSGRCWLDRNLGATQVATSSYDALSFGDYFQWGRGADGHQLSASTTTTTASGSDNPLYADFMNGVIDWRSPSNNNLWQGVNGINNPCPSGWRVPTIAELAEEVSGWSSPYDQAAMNSPLKLPMAGWRSDVDGSYIFGSFIGSYWSSTGASSPPGDQYANVLLFHSVVTLTDVSARAAGNPIRCIKACPVETGSVTLSGNQTICIGSASAFSSTTSGGAWSSSNTAIASVNATSGVVTGVSGGTTTITYTIAATGSCAAVTTTRTITVTAAPVFNTNSIAICPNATYRITVTTASPVLNGWSCTGGGLSVSNGYVTAGSSTGSGTVHYTDGCGVTASATVAIMANTVVPRIEVDRIGAHRFNGNPQGPLLSGYTINYSGYNGYNYLAQDRPSAVGFYRASLQSGSAAGCPCEYYIYNCPTCDPPVNEPVYTDFVCGTSSVTFTYSGLSVTYGTVVGANGKCWLDRNLGASRVAISSTDHLGYGDLFQWGRAADGHQSITWSNSSSGVGGTTTSTLSNTDIPGYGNFIRSSGTTTTFPFGDWRSPQNANLWQGVNGINNPCPSGWRVPSQADWESESLRWSSSNSVGAYLSPLKLAVSGLRSLVDGSLINVGQYGNYWSSTPGFTDARSLHFNSNTITILPFYRSGAGAVRCVKD